MHVTLIPQYHPSAALHQPRLWATLLQDWEFMPVKVPADYILRPVITPDPNIKLAAFDTETDGAGGLGVWSIAHRNPEGRIEVNQFRGIRKDIHWGQTALVMHNAKYDLRELDKFRMARPSDFHDSMVMAYCLIPSTKVLTKNLEWLPIGSLEIGDELVGIDEELPIANLKKGRRLMKPCRVIGLARRNAEVYKLTFSNGKQIQCTAEHPWLTSRLGCNAGVWRRTDQLRIGWKMTSNIPTWITDSSWEGGYASGLFDGEGDINKFSVNFSQNPGIIFSWMTYYLTKNNYRFVVNRNKNCLRIYLWGLNDVFRLLGSVRPRRLLAKDTWIGRTPTRQTMETVRITSIEKVGIKEVVSIETTAHTFNAEGFWTHNCMGLGKQAPSDDARESSGSNMVGGLGLKYLARRQLGMEMIAWKDVAEHPELQPEYNARDSVATLLLAEKWLPQLPQHYWTIDKPLLPVLMAIEDRGMHIDPNFLTTFEMELDEKIKAINLPINPNSPKQVGDYIYNTLGVTPWKFTETKQPSTDSDVLEKIDDPVVKAILEYRALAKDKSTYVDNYVNARDSAGRIHPELKQTSTSTGRLSCARPNLQNIPKIDSVMRGLFDCAPGFVLVRADFHLLEFGCLAVLAGDDELINAFLHEDVHQLTADGCGVDRDTGKHMNFLMQNGGGPWGMSSTYGIPINLAKEYFAKYHRRFPALKKFQDKTLEEAKATKHVKGYFGRTRRVDALFASNWQIRKDGEKEAMTFPMQNLGAEISKLGMIDLCQKHNAPMTIQVHDEYIMEVPASQGRDYALWLKEYIPKITPIKGVEFPVEVSVGRTWLDCLKKENIL